MQFPEDWCSTCILRLARNKAGSTILDRLFVVLDMELITRALCVCCRGGLVYVLLTKRRKISNAEGIPSLIFQCKEAKEPPPSLCFKAFRTLIERLMYPAQTGYSECVHSTGVLFYRERQRNVARIITNEHSHCIRLQLPLWFAQTS